MSDYPDFDWYEGLVYDCPFEGCPFYVFGAWSDLNQSDDNNPSVQALRRHWDEAHRSDRPV